MMSIPFFLFLLHRTKHLIRTLGIFATVALMSSSALSQESTCGSPFQTGFGPFDYRTDRSQLSIVERFHFTPAVEANIPGSSGDNPGADLSYTLRAFPNHHRALIAMMNLGRKLKTDQPKGAKHTVECFFDRALRFRPDDTVARLIYVQYLTRSSRVEEATVQLKLTETYAEDNPMTQYNLGLSYFELKAYDKALLFAHKALELGYPRPDLRENLAAIGKWVEPISAAPDKPASSPK